jgi:hypothetical protein
VLAKLGVLGGDERGGHHPAGLQRHPAAGALAGLAQPGRAIGAGGGPADGAAAQRVHVGNDALGRQVGGPRAGRPAQGHALQVEREAHRAAERPAPPLGHPGPKERNHRLERRVGQLEVQVKVDRIGLKPPGHGDLQRAELDRAAELAAGPVPLALRGEAEHGQGPRCEVGLVDHAVDEGEAEGAGRARAAQLEGGVGGDPGQLDLPAKLGPRHALIEAELAIGALHVGRGPERAVEAGEQRLAPQAHGAVDQLGGGRLGQRGQQAGGQGVERPRRGGGPGSGGEQALEIDGVGVNHGLDHPQPGRGQQAQLEAGDLDPRPADPRPVVLGEGGPPPADLQVGLAQGALHAVKGALAGQAEARHPRAQGRHAEQREGGEAAARQPPPHRGRRRGRAAGRARRGWCAAGRLGRGPARSGRGRAPRGRRPRAKPGAPRRR